MKRTRAKKRRQLLDHVKGKVVTSNPSHSFIHRNIKEQIKPISGWNPEYAERFGMEPNTRGLRWGNLTIFAAQSKVGWHVTVSHPTRYPTWDEMSDIRYAVIPDDVTMALILPPSDQYINLHPNCFQLWEVKDGYKQTLGWLSRQISQMRG